MSRRPLLAPLVAVLAMAATLTGCSGSGSDAAAGKLKVVAAFYPLQYAAEQVGGDAVSVTTLTPPGVEPHDLELTAAQVAQIKDADAIIYLPGFQPAVDTAIAQQAPDKAIDASAGITLLPRQAQEGASSSPSTRTDPHVWLNPANMTTIGANLAAALAKDDPAAAQGLTSRADAFGVRMQGLSSEFSAGLKSCTIKDMVVSHEAFAYLAQAYGLTQVGIAGLSPEVEPSPARLSQVADLVRANGVTTIYYETLVDPKVAQTLASETGAVAAVLDPLEGLTEGSTGDYPSIMRENLSTLRKGQNCP